MRRPDERTAGVVTVLVPRPGTPAGNRIDVGSGIVTADATSDRVLVYYEGNRYGAMNLRTFEERVFHATARLVERYPTVAFGQYARADFDVVGTFAYSADWKERRLEIADAARVQAWTEA